MNNLDYSTTKIEKFIEKIALDVRNATQNRKSGKFDENGIDRQMAAELAVSRLVSEFESVGEVPAKGANGSIIELSDKYRIQYRCGYGKWNYAPCIEISKEYLQQVQL